MPKAKYEISIHVLREEDDAAYNGVWDFDGLFLSTSSARRTTKNNKFYALDLIISIHVLREEDDK